MQTRHRESHRDCVSHVPLSGTIEPNHRKFLAGERNPASPLSHSCPTCQETGVWLRAGASGSRSFWPCPADYHACATRSYPEKFVAFVRPGMGGELHGGMLRSSVCLGGGPLVVPRQMGLESAVLELRPLPAPRAGRDRSLRDPGADGSSGRSWARGGVVCTLCYLGCLVPPG